MTLSEACYLEKPLKWYISSRMTWSVSCSWANPPYAWESFWEAQFGWSFWSQESLRWEAASPAGTGYGNRIHSPGALACRCWAVLGVAGISISLQVITGFHHASCWSHWWLAAVQLFLILQPQCTLSSLHGSRHIPSLFVSPYSLIDFYSSRRSRARGSHYLCQTCSQLFASLLPCLEDDSTVVSHRFSCLLITLAEDSQQRVQYAQVGHNNNAESNLSELQPGNAKPYHAKCGDYSTCSWIPRG